MHYSKLLLLALPLVSAAPLSTITHVVTEYFTVTITANGQIFTQVASSTELEVVDATQAAIQAPTSRQSNPANTNTNSQPAPTPAPTPSPSPETSSRPSPNSPAPSPSQSPVGLKGASGCPIDPAAPVSGGIGGNPSKSVQESVNYIRRLYNPNARCLGWSPTLASASLACVNARDEGKLRANSNVVSDDGGYGKPNPWFNGPQATTDFESSMFTLLCQSPDDGPLQVNGKSGCAGPVGEKGCTEGPCTGHRDALIDAQGAFDFVGAGWNTGNGWASTSFSKTCDVFGAC